MSNLERTKLLLDVVHAAAAAGPGYSNLIAIAGVELRAMDDEAAKEIAKAKEETDKKAAAEAAKKAKVEADEAKDEESKAAASSPTLVPAGDVGRKI